ADSRTNTYDQFWSYDGMIVLVSAGNDGPDSDTITPPATAKNVVAVGNHHNRYSGAPNTLAEGSSRGPTDDGRIKPDVTAPGTWVRSCLSQDADDLSGASWESQWYVEYSGTSMAAPNAAGASVLIREYLMEIAGRPAPQGALIKGLLILGAEDAGSRDIPNMNEGWGRVNLVNSLIPGTDTGIWVDDRTTVRSGQTREYLFNLTRSNTPFKAVLTWSDYPGNTWSNKQLQNDLDMVVIAPDGTEYLGNDFANGRSTTGGDADDVNNVEVALIDQADMGVWTIRITDVAHGGQRSDQAFALAVRGAGVNDLRSDPLPVASSLLLSTEIPQVNDLCEISIQIHNQGGGPANNLRVEAIAGGQNLGEVEMDLGPGMTQWVSWDWTPSSEGQQSIIVRIDPDDDKEEIDEDNNLFERLIAVSAPGVRVTTDLTTKEIDDAGATSTSWDFTIRNTALLPTNASISSTRPVLITSGQEMTSWFTSFSQTTFDLQGSESVSVGFTLVHDASPSPGLYQFTVTARDDENDIDFPLTMALRVPTLPSVSFQANFQTLMVHPTEPTQFSVDIENEGNGNQGYNIYLEPPPNWALGLDSLGSTIGSTSGSTGAIPVDGTRTVEMTFVPPNGVPLAAGLSYTANMRVISQINPEQFWLYPIQYEVMSFESGLIEKESEYGVLQPDSTLYIQFTITNLGNTPLTLYPNIDDRPGGWSVVMGAQTLQVPVGDSIPYVLGLEGNGLAIGGPLNVYMTTAEGYRIHWNGTLEVTGQSNPILNFENTKSVDGDTLTEQPAGETFVATWTLENGGSESWTPTIELDISEQNSSSSCDSIGEVLAGETITISCSITIPNLTPAGSHPELLLKVVATGTEVTSTTSLTIAEHAIVQWRTISIEEAVNGNLSNVHLEIVNMGNTVISDRIIIDAPNDWTLDIQGSGVADIPIGGTQSIVVQIVPGSSGTSALDLSLESPGVAGSSTSISIDVLSNPDIDESKNSKMDAATIIAISGLVIFVIAGLALAGILVVKLRQPSSATSHSNNAVSNQQNAAYLAMMNQATAQQYQQYQQTQAVAQQQASSQTIQEGKQGEQ
ncbi:MAG: S8 family serine peptidase, partial [Candidatus Thermoplasmatota archaeon]|nr:S8 family serine peptidase [Candidatus Thermoplasmatota archaeon]MEE3083142.1 S8 family serine peptidase [Candidatus Thermoplasmatota archaeon]